MKRVLSFILALGMVLYISCSSKMKKTATEIGLYLKDIEQIDSHMESVRQDQIDAAGFDDLGLRINNDTPLDELLRVEYSLKDLRDYFDEHFDQSPAFHQQGSAELSEWLEANNIETVHSFFPIEVIRQKDAELFYSVYRVKEGGYFYVFWSYHFPYSPVMENFKTKLTANSVLYLDQAFPDEKAFFRMEGKTWDYVEKKAGKDAVYEWDVLTNRSKASYCLEDGKEIILTLSSDKTSFDKKDYRVVSCETTGKYHLFSEILFQDLPEKIKENTWTMENLAVGMDEKQISYLWKDAAYLGDSAKPSAKTVCSLDDDRLIAASYLVTHKEDGSIYIVFIYEKEKVVSILLFDQENKLIKHDGKEILFIDKSVFSDVKGKNFALLKNELAKNSCFKELSVKDADGVKVKLYYYFGQTGNIYEITVKNNMIEKVTVFPMLTIAP